MIQPSPETTVRGCFFAFKYVSYICKYSDRKGKNMENTQNTGRSDRRLKKIRILVPSIVVFVGLFVAAIFFLDRDIYVKYENSDIFNDYDEDIQVGIGRHTRVFILIDDKGNFFCFEAKCPFGNGDSYMSCDLDGMEKTDGGYYYVSKEKANEIIDAGFNIPYTDSVTDYLMEGAREIDMPYRLFFEESKGGRITIADDEEFEIKG